jgi:DNA-binding IclR family transcriptional regulator
MTGYRDSNSSADRALEILMLFDEERLTLTGADVVTRLGIGRSTAYRYLQSLAATGFLEEAGGRAGYRLGARVLQLARLAGRGVNLVDLARPVMRALREQAGETVLLARRSGEMAVCLAIEESDQPVRTSLPVGHLLPLNAGGPALVLLAWAPPEVVDRVLASGLARFTTATVTDPAAIRERLAVVRDHGFAISRGEFESGVVGVAAPVGNVAGEVVAAIGVIGLTRRMPDERIPALANQVRDAAAEISALLELVD